MERYSCSLVCLIVSAIFVFQCCQAAGVSTCGNPQKIPCDNSQCISRDLWCDGDIDCDDGSDEQYCEKAAHWWNSVPDNHCTEKHFTCDDGPCFPAVVRCDNFDDCSDFSDEEGCEKNTTVANLGQPESRGESDIPEHTTSDSISRYDADAHEPSSSTTTVRSTTTTTSTTTTRPTWSSTTPTAFTRFPTSTYDYGKKWGESTQPNARYPYDQRRIDPYNPYYNSQNHYGPTVNPSVPQRRYPTPGTNNRGYGTTRYPGRTVYNLDQNGRARYPGNYYGQNQNGRARYPGNYYQPDGSYSSNRGSDTAPSQLVPANERFSPQPAASPTSDAAIKVEHDPSRTARNSLVQRQRPTFVQPRTVLHPPNPRQLNYARSKAQHSALPPFYFPKNYTEEIGDLYVDNIEIGKQWLIHQRNRSYVWGDDTPRALVALSLITNSFTSDVVENELMKKSLQIHLGTELLRSKKQPMPVTRLAMYINALLATCQNPRDFLGLDLVDELFRRRYEISRNQHQTGYNHHEISPFVFLTLCLSNSHFYREDIQELEKLLFPRFEDELKKDKHILATSALACILQRNFEHNYDARSHLRQVEERVNEAVYNLLNIKKNDGSFDNIYSTALAAQALMSVNSSFSWDPRPTLDYLARHQLEDGSFGDMLSTYYILPALSGRSLLHLRNTQCDKASTGNAISTPEKLWNRPGPRKNVLYSLAIEFPERISFAMQLDVPEVLNALEIMVIAEYLDPRFRFQYQTSSIGTHVFSISGVPNDPERRYYWNFYLLNSPTSDLDLRTKHTGDLKQVFPRNGTEMFFWYHNGTD